MRTDIDNFRFWCWCRKIVLAVAICSSAGFWAEEPASPDPIQTAKAVDEAIEAELALSKTSISGKASDEDFLSA